MQELAQKDLVPFAFKGGIKFLFPSDIKASGILLLTSLELMVMGWF